MNKEPAEDIKQVLHLADTVARISERGIMVGSEAEDGRYFCFFGCGAEWAVWRDADTFPKEADHDQNCPWRFIRTFNKRVNE
jgi:hypothetical protein